MFRNTLSGKEFLLQLIQLLVEDLAVVRKFVRIEVQMQIHDELSWEYDPSDPPTIFFNFKKIMEDWEKGKIPIVADMEVTTKTWADKQEINNIEELKGALNVRT